MITWLFRLLGKKKVFIAILGVFCLTGVFGMSSKVHAATVNAASCSQANVQTAFNSASTGDTVVIPAGTCAWTTQVSWTAPADVTVQGAGDSSLGGGDQTIITDDFGTNSPLLSISVSSSGTFRMTGITFQGGTGGLKENGILAFGGPGTIRLDHLHINKQTYSDLAGTASSKVMVIGGGVKGVLDHSILDLYGIGWIHIVNGTNEGNTDWAATAGFGTDNFFFIEDNQVNGTTNGTVYDGALTDCHTGGHYVVRFNTLVATAIGQTHPTGHSSDDRGCRSHEIYGNLVTSPLAKDPNFTLDYNNSGAALDWGNTANNVFKSIFYFNSIRKDNSTYNQAATPSGWGYCGTAFNGTGSAWDENSNASTGYACIDDPGRGQGDLLTGDFPNKINSTTGTIHWPNQALEPIYIWSNNASIVSGWGGNYYANLSNGRIASDREYYTQASGIQTSATSPFNGTTGTGWGTLANRPTTCTTGVGYFATDQGSWNTSVSNSLGVQQNGSDGVLYKCTSTNTWTSYYTPYTYPHPLVSGGGDSTPPTITSVSSDKTNGSYKAGDVIDIDVTFSEAVTSTGNVTVTLETGTTDRTCTFTVSNATTGTCDYTVQAGDTSSDLTTNSISGTIEDQNSNAMSNFTPTTNLAANKAIVIDTTAPSAPSGLSLQSPSTSPGNDTTPTITVSGVTSGDTVTLHTNSSCTAQVATGTAAGSTINLTSSTLSEATYSFYAKSTDVAGNASSCSSATVSYVLDTTAPTNQNTVFASSTTKIGGASVTIVSSGTASNAVWFAPSGTTTFSASSTMTTAGGTATSLLAPATAGAYKLFVIDAAGNASSASTATLTVDNTAPVRSAGSPSGILSSGTTSTTLSLTTDENATCKYGTVSGTAYGSIASTFTTTGGTSHSQTLNSLSDGSSYTYYVRCQDTATNANTNDYTISFSVASSGGDSTSPVLTEVTAIGSTSDSTPNYTFSSTEAGSITYGGDCRSTTTTAVSGNNTVKMNSLSRTTHSNCTIVVTDASNNASSPLSITSFTIKKKSSSSSSSSKKKSSPSRTIVQSKSSLVKGEVLVQSGKKFSKNSPVFLYFSKPRGGYYPPTRVTSWSTGSFSVSYRVTKPPGTYSWYALDVKTGKASKVKTYTVR